MVKKRQRLSPKQIAKRRSRRDKKAAKKRKKEQEQKRFDRPGRDLADKAIITGVTHLTRLLSASDLELFKKAVQRNEEQYGEHSRTILDHFIRNENTTENHASELLLSINQTNPLPVPSHLRGKVKPVETKAPSATKTATSKTTEEMDETEFVNHVLTTAPQPVNKLGGKEELDNNERLLFEFITNPSEKAKEDFVTGIGFGELFGYGHECAISKHNYKRVVHELTKEPLLIREAIDVDGFLQYSGLPSVENIKKGEYSGLEGNQLARNLTMLIGAYLVKKKREQS